MPLNGVGDGTDMPLSTPDRRMDAITPLPRQAFLLTAVESFAPDQASRILDVARARLRWSGRGRRDAKSARRWPRPWLIIEDEPIIAMDLENLVTSLGHKVVAVARTKDEAVAMAHSERPGLVLADINLGDGGSGIDAVNEILDAFDIPVIFITAYPEKLLTGERPEPTFLIAKPFLPKPCRRWWARPCSSMNCPAGGTPFGLSRTVGPQEQVDGGFHRLADGRRVFRRGDAEQRRLVIIRLAKLDELVGGELRVEPDEPPRADLALQPGGQLDRARPSAPPRGKPGRSADFSPPRRSPCGCARDARPRTSGSSARRRCAAAPARARVVIVGGNELEHLLGLQAAVMPDQRLEQALLRGEIDVERAFRNPGGQGDVVHAGAVEPVGQEILRAPSRTWRILSPPPCARPKASALRPGGFLGCEGADPGFFALARPAEVRFISIPFKFLTSSLARIAREFALSRGHPRRWPNPRFEGQTPREREATEANRRLCAYL